MSNKLKKTKNNLKLILGSKDKPKTQDELDRDAELTLLYQALSMSPDELTEFLTYYEIPREEYDYLVKKYSRILNAYKEANPCLTNL